MNNLLPQFLEMMVARENALQEHYVQRPGPCPIQYRKDLTFPMFRYSKRRFVDPFFDHGQLRLSPVLSYRQVEHFNEAVGDNGEGQAHFYTLKLKYPTAISTLIQNRWTICCAQQRDDARMMKEFEADSCFQINSMEFFFAITDHIARWASSCLIDRIVYIREWGVNIDEQAPGAPLFAGLYKRQKHAYQTEVRPLWEVKGYVLPKERMLDLEGHVLEQRMKEEVEQEIARVAYKDITVPAAIRHCTLLF